MDKTGIWNLALGHVRAAPVGSHSEFSAAALACQNFYDLCLGLALAEAPWRFATGWQVLAQTAETVPGWGYTFSLPNDFVRLWKASPLLLDADPYIYSTESVPDAQHEMVYCSALAAQVVAADEDAIIAQVTTKVAEGLFSPAFCSALSHLLAAHIAVPIAGVELGRILRKENMDAYLTALAAATVQDASHHNQERRVSRYEAARR